MDFAVSFLFLPSPSVLFVLKVGCQKDGYPGVGCGERPGDAEQWIRRYWQVHSFSFQLEGQMKIDWSIQCVIDSFESCVY